MKGSLAGLSLDERPAELPKVLFKRIKTSDVPLSTAQIQTLSSESYPSTHLGSVASSLPKVLPARSRIDSLAKAVPKSRSLVYESSSLQKLDENTMVMNIERNRPVKRTQILDSDDDSDAVPKGTPAKNLPDSEYTYDVYTLSSNIPDETANVNLIRIESFDVPSLEHEYDSDPSDGYTSDSNDENYSGNSYPEDEDSSVSSSDSKQIRRMVQWGEDDEDDETDSEEDFYAKNDDIEFEVQDSISDDDDDNYYSNSNDYRM